MTASARFVLCSSIGALVASLWFFGPKSGQTNTSRNATVAVAPVRPAATQLVAAQLNEASDAKSTKTGAVSKALRVDPVIPAAVQQLLPSVGEAVRNWKEFKPQKITIAPYPDMPIEFEATSIEESQGRTVWTGRNALIPGAFLAAAATENDWHATLVIPPVGAFEVHISGQTVTMLAKNHDEEICGTGLSVSLLMQADALRATEDLPEVSSPLAAADDVSTSDVVFFYDADTLSRAQNVSNFETRMIAHIVSSNLALENSKVTNFKWRYRASYQVPDYVPTDDMTHDLRVITGRNEEHTAFVANPVSDFVTAKAILHGADQVVLYVGGNRNYGGIAWILEGPDGPRQPIAYHSAVVAWNSSYVSLAHELSHNFGCRHDRETDGAVDGNGKFNYGYRFLDRSNRDTGTIMSYANNRVPYFSNPQVTFDGYILGVLETEPKAANNARTLQEAAVAMIGSRVAVETPTITTQPQSVAVVAGQSFTLSVTSTGVNRVYQWKFNDVVISGATETSYGKSAAGSSDAGSYTVTISNIAGQVTSSVAVVTVNAAPTGGSGSSSPASGGGGGGGGGGAVDGWFASLLGLFVMARCIRKKKRA